MSSSRDSNTIVFVTFVDKNKIREEEKSGNRHFEKRILVLQIK